MKTRIRTIYVMRSATKEQEARPSVFIEVVKGGDVVYGVRSTGSSVKVARERAQEAFSELERYIRDRVIRDPATGEEVKG